MPIVLARNKKMATQKAEEKHDLPIKKNNDS
jgi:hypothetical protein